MSLTPTSGSAASEEMSPVSGSLNEVSSPEGRGKRILVAEDDQNILRQIVFNLESSDYEVITATTGVEAMRLLLGSKPDLLITDIMMPEMDGYELVSTLRRDEVLADLPVIMLTAKTLDDDVAQGYGSGTDLYLTKPFNPVELLSFVQRILG
jgi:two-component system alkaline phosphatase synthesis response regulator PhoP/two-component system response regulator VicR